MIKKKALSPLIATILLVAVALSLAGILYSWSSQNFKDTTTSVSNTSSDWIDCSNVNLYIEECSYSPLNGFDSLIIYDRSTIQIDKNLVVTIIDNANNIVSTEVIPSFIGNAMSLGTILNDVNGVNGLSVPLKKVSISPKNCPDRVAHVSRCD